MGAINPSNYYQETKRTSEELIAKSGTTYTILRPSIGFGVSPNKQVQNISNKIVQAIETSGPSQFDISLICQPTYLGHIVEVIKTIIDQNVWNKTIPIAVSSEKSVFDIAQDVLTGLGGKISPIDLHKPKFNSVENIDQELLQFGMPTLSYASFVERFQKEILRKESFRIL